MITYDIRDFFWDKESNTFHAIDTNLHDVENRYLYAFPSGREQFVIANFQTGNFRRFRLKRDFEDLLEFTSEDEILCRVWIDASE